MDCPGTDIQNRQYFKTKYISSNYSLPLYLTVGQPYGANASFLTINFDNKDFEDPIYDLSVSKFQTMLLLNGKQYSALHMISEYHYADTIYFSKDYGIVKIVSNGNIWTIIQ